MSVTSTEIRINLVDITAKDDSTPSSTDKQSFSDPTEIKDIFTVSKFATQEQDQWLFGENFKVFPSNTSLYSWGYWSLSQSDVNGDFGTPPELLVEFTSNHTSSGITLEFWGITNDYCDDVTIEWYDSGDVLIDSQNFTPDSVSYFCDNLVENYRKVNIIFNATNKGYRYVKLKNVEYGELALFDDSFIRRANLIEEVDLTSDTISINTSEFELRFDTSARAEQILSVLQESQEVRITEIVDSVEKFMGLFFVDEKKLIDDKTLLISSQDWISILEGTNFIGGIYSSVTVSTIISLIMTSAGLSSDDYIIETGLQSLTVSGYLPIMSHKEALQRVVFAVNGVIDCSRSEKIKIYTVSTASTTLLDKNDFFKYEELDTNKQFKPVTGIILNVNQYVANTTTSTLYKVTVASGTHTAYFREPATSLGITGGTITDSGANFATFTTAGGLVTITGYTYDVSILKTEKNIADLPAQVRKNVITFENSLLYDLDINAQYLFDYETFKSMIEFDYIVADEVMSEQISLTANYSKTFTGFIVSNDIDLSGGFRGQIKAYGEVV